METVTVKGTGPRAQRLLDEMEAGTKGLTKTDETTKGEVIERVYLVEGAGSPEDASEKTRAALGSAADEFEIS